MLVAGGEYVYPTSEIFDPSTQTWLLTGPLIQRRKDHGALVLNDGTVLIAGGSYESPPCTPKGCTFHSLMSAEIFTPDSEQGRISGD